ncbi:MAG: flavin reductase [Acidobacteria bacterium ACB1]|nr:4-nitrophenol 4-monooxygenase/4-nitrocatechol 2-monooxygenase, reductase component [Pyrinomonadaceae bacterium]MCE7961972.1 flavin reductase [Acidobacteria bacterium ACB1]
MHVGTKRMISNEEFRRAMSHFASGVTVITTRDAAGAPHGITVSAFCSLSVEPPLVLACINKMTGSHYAFIERRAFVVHILGEHQRHVSEQFAEPLLDKFAGMPLQETESGLPVITGALVTLECSLVQNYDGGDHSILVAEVKSSTVNDAKPLIYFRGDYRLIDLGD